MKEEIGWIIVVSAIVLVVLSISVPTAVYHSNKNSRISEAIATGAKPLEVMCAFDNAYIEVCRDLINRQ